MAISSLSISFLCLVISFPDCRSILICHCITAFGAWNSRSRIIFMFLLKRGACKMVLQWNSYISQTTPRILVSILLAHLCIKLSQYLAQLFRFKHFVIIVTFCSFQPVWKKRKKCLTPILFIFTCRYSHDTQCTVRHIAYFISKLLQHVVRMWNCQQNQTAKANKYFAFQSQYEPLRSVPFPRLDFNQSVLVCRKAAHNLPLRRTCSQGTPDNTIYLRLVMSFSNAITWH